MAILNTSNPVELSRALVLAYKPQAFFRRMCSTITHRTKSFLIDIEKKTRFLAPYVRDEEDGKVIARDGYETITYTPPKVGASRNITAKDLEIRLPGQSIVDISAETASSEAVMSGLVIEDMLDLQRSIERREEQQIVEILSTGKVITGVGDDINAPIPAENIFTASAGDKFDAQNSDPIKWMRKQSRDKVALSGGTSVRRAVFGGQAWDAFVANAAVQTYLNNRRIDLGAIAPREDQDFPGVTFQGRIEGVDLYTYDEYFFDDKQKKNSPMMPTDRVILLGGNPRFEMHYGAVFDGANGTINKTQTYAWEWIEKGKIRWRELESHPLFIPVNGGSVVSAKVV